MSAIVRDIRDSGLYRTAEMLFSAARRPGTGEVSDATDIHVSPDGAYAVFAGAIMERLEGTAPTRICQVDLESGALRVLTTGAPTDRSPRYAPDGRSIAFLSDRCQHGCFELYLLDPLNGSVRETPPVAGWVEYLHWSPDGTRILLGVAGHGADLAGAQGALRGGQSCADVPDWMPTVETGDETYRWRSAWIYDLSTHQVRQVSPSGLNVWEASWCGNEALALVASPGPGEGLWYSAQLHTLDLRTGQARRLYTPVDQLGWPAATPSGEYVAVVEALCSDRWVVAGELCILDTRSATPRRIDTQGVDVTWTEWRSDRTLLFGGHRRFETVIALYDLIADRVSEIWSSREITSSGRYLTLAGFGKLGDCVFVSEGFLRGPEIALIRQGKYRPVLSLDPDYSAQVARCIQVHPLTWSAPDGVTVEGWLLTPVHAGPYPLIMNLHGGPVWHWRPMYLKRWRDVLTLLLVQRGYAVFLPNPRGSVGQGQKFIRYVLGDMGGADAQDCLAGLDHLVACGIANPERLGVTGISYGGFLSSWLIGQDARFKAAVSVAPFNNQVTEHLLSNIPTFVSLFLADSYTNFGGKYFQRSPIMHAHKVKTPTLHICGALDRSAPAEEAVQMHNALLENGVKSVLVTYPREGHGIRHLPAAIDYTARVTAWFEEHV
jgi:dipeptidyl aminopeptidase/acylaminoacyl peptidase